MTKPTAIDLFAGAGGATQGLTDAGFAVIGAVESDRDAAATYRQNHEEVRLWEQDIRYVPASAMRRSLALARGELALLKGCPPCQGFSTLAEGRAAVDERRNDLVAVMARFARELLPKAILVENVPGLGRDSRAAKLISDFEGLGYAVKSYVVDAQSFGVPQRRKRYLILAIRGRKNAHQLPTSLDGVDVGLGGGGSVRSAFEQLGQLDLSGDPLSDERPLSDLLARRIRAIPVGGDRFDLPVHLQLKCHVALDSRRRAATSSYGRMRWDEPAPTMTTRCTTPASGAFIHPDQDRPITLREAATLQTFPADYSFSGSRTSIERQIGNAVPVRMASALGRIILGATAQG